MSRGHKPVAGSRGFWPKKRASRIYGSITTHPETKETVPLDFAGYKAGMTSAVVVDNRKASVTHGQEIVKSVTIIDCPPLSVAAVRLYRKTPYGMQAFTDIWAEKFSKDLGRKTFLPAKSESKKRIEEAERDPERIADVRLLVHTRPKDSGIGKKKPELFELCLGGNPKDKWNYAKQKLGGEIKAEEMFKEGDWIDVKAVSKGKGYQGPVKRFGVKIRGRKHTKKRRHIGNIGPRGVAHVLAGKIAMAGQLGFQTRTEYNKRILKIGADGKMNPKGGWINYGLVPGHYLLVEGSIPGSKKRLIMLRKGIRVPESRKEPVEIRHIVLESQQGV